MGRQNGRITLIYLVKSDSFTINFDTEADCQFHLLPSENFQDICLLVAHVSISECTEAY